MTFIYLADDMPDHPKIAGLSDRAFRMQITAICYAGHYLTDGEVSLALARKAGPRVVDELVEAGLWSLVPERRLYVVHDFLDYNRSRAEAEARRKQLSEWGRQGAAKRWLRP